MKIQEPIEATEREIQRAYLDLRRMLTTGRSQEAVKQAIGLADQNEVALWNYLREYASLEINYRDTTPLLAVKALSENWEAQKNPAFIAHAVLTLVCAPKGDPITKFLG